MHLQTENGCFKLIRVLIPAIGTLDGALRSAAVSELRGDPFEGLDLVSELLRLFGDLNRPVSGLVLLDAVVDFIQLVLADESFIGSLLVFETDATDGSHRVLQQIHHFGSLDELLVALLEQQARLDFTLYDFGGYSGHE